MEHVLAPSLCTSHPPLGEVHQSLQWKDMIGQFCMGWRKNLDQSKMWRLHTYTPLRQNFLAQKSLPTNMEFESAHESELTSSNVEIKEQTELVQTETEMAAEVLQEQTRETTQSCSLTC